MTGVDAIQLARFRGEVEGEMTGTRQAMDAERAITTPDEGDDWNADAGSATHVLEQKALALEERSRSLASKNEHLQDRLSMALREIEDIVRSNKVLRAGLLEAERAGAADANPVHALLFKAAAATEAAAGTVAAAAAGVHAAANAAKAGFEREADSTNQEEVQARELMAAAATMELQVRKLEKDATRLEEIARKITPETLAARAAEERNAWEWRATEWEGEAARLAVELEDSEERAANAHRELEVVKAMSCDLVQERCVLEQEAAAAMGCRDTERRDELEASQAALRSLTSTAGGAARSSEVALDDMRDFRLKVAAEKKEEEKTACHVSVSGCSERNGAGEQAYFSEQAPHPHSAAARRQGDTLQLKGLTRVPDNDEDDDIEILIDRKTFPRTSWQTAPRSSNRGGWASRFEETDHRREVWSGGGRHSNRSSLDIGEHVCGLCGAPNVSFGKLVDCRLKLDRARAELSEARARIAYLDKNTTMHAEAGAKTEARVRETAPVVQSAAPWDGENQVVADLTSLQEEETDFCQATREPFAQEGTALSKSQRRVHELELEVRRLLALLEAADSEIDQRALLAQNKVGVYARHRRRNYVNGSIRAQSSGGRGAKPHTDEDDDANICRRGGSIDRQERSLHQMINIRGESEIIPETRSGEICDTDGARRKDSRVTASAGTMRTRENTERERTRQTVIALEDSCRSAREEAEHLKRRIRRLRVALREAKESCDDVEASRVEADAAASAAGTALAAVTAEAKAAMASRHEVEEKAFSAERQHRIKAETLEVELSRATAVAIEAREQCKMAQGEVLRLRQTTTDAQRRVASLEKCLALLTGTLFDADAGRVRALVGRVRDLAGRGWEGEGRCTDDLAGHASTSGAVNSTSTQDQHACARTGVLSRWPLEGSSSGSSSSDRFEVTTLRSRLTASQAQHMELVRASEEVVARCNQRCEARVRAALAAGRLMAACSHQHGLVSGREIALEAAGRLAVVKRCFRALREDALLRSRDRSVRRQRRMKIWIADAFERSGEEVQIMARRKHVQN